ncbi:GmrSD restriction endonuclease domain-containing protein [Helicobacter pylori]
MNLKYQPNMDNPEDNYQFEFHAQKPENDKEHWWFKVGDILELESVWDYAQEHDLKGDRLKLLETLNKAFHDKQLISYFEETEKNLNKVLNIFIRVNSGGVKLSYSDLLMSILTASFSSDIRERMHELVDTLKDKGFSNVGQDQVLKTCLLLIGKDTTFELKNFNKKNIKEIEDNWEKITESIYNATELLKTFGYAGYLSSAYILSSLAYFYFLNPKKMDKNDEGQALKFVRNAQITSYFTPSTDTKLSVIAHSIKEAQTFERFNHNLAKHQTWPLKITNDAIEEMMCSSSHALVFPILQILYPHLNCKTNTFHIDHIYPKSKFNEKNEKLNQDFYKWGDYLFNLQLLEGQENSVKKDKDPESWLKEEYKDERAIEEYKKRNYIDPTLKLEWENIKEFREKREEAIIKTLKEALLPKS